MRQVAAFDFDGTLLQGDAVFPFCAQVGGRTRAIKTLVRHWPKMVSVALGSGDRDIAKAAFVRGCLKGLTTTSVDTQARIFASRIVCGRLFPQTVERLRWHKEQGHEVVIVSASLEVYLKPIADLLDVPYVLATKLQSVDNTYTGELDGPNVRAQQKARCLETFLDGNDYEMWAYGNSADDDAMLAMAQHCFRVDKEGRLASEAATTV